MLQRFFKDTLGSRFIKSLLAQTSIPVFDCVFEGDFITEGCYYIYKDVIIKCEGDKIDQNPSGRFYVNPADKLYPSDTLFPSNFLFIPNPINDPIATYTVVKYINTKDSSYCCNYESSKNYYDSETHYHLGRYLRYLKSTTGLNLFPFYNCFNATYFNDIHLFRADKKVQIERVNTAKMKVVAIPILFGKEYSIHIDCSSEVLMRACVYDSTGFVKETLLPDNLKDILNGSGRVYSNLRFHNPVKFSISTSDKSAACYSRDMYLIVQLPLNNTSAIVVYENFEAGSGVKCDINSVQRIEVVNPKLTAFNTYESCAFSERLLEYLIGNVICRQDAISRNVYKIQQILRTRDEDYDTFLKDWEKSSSGVWDSNLQNQVMKVVYNEMLEKDIYDQDGNINKDVESILIDQETGVIY